jgi:hypothetical protein
MLSERRPAQGGSEPAAPRREPEARAPAHAAVLALQRASGNRATARLVQRMQQEARQFSTDNGLDLGGDANYLNVSAYVADKANPRNLRLGLRAAWNERRPANHALFIEIPRDLSNPYHHSTFSVYRDFTTDSKDVVIPIYGGQVRARFNQGAPFIQSRAEDWGGAKVGDSYRAYVNALRTRGRTDPEIAAGLLALSDDDFQTDMEKRAAAMLTMTVYLAEEWRKQGAAKIYRAILRRIVDGSRTFDDFLTDFAYVPSADAGRRMAARFYDAWLDPANKAALSANEQETFDAMSDVESDDFSSVDEMRTDEKKNLKKTRLYAIKHQTT